MPAPLYARGEKAWGLCQRCGLKDLLENLILDEYHPNIRVHPECWDPKHPQERLEPLADAVALWRPSPESNNAVAPVLSGEQIGISVNLSWTAATTLGPRFENYRLYRATFNSETGEYGEYEEIFEGAITYDDFMAIVDEDLGYEDDGIGLGAFRYYVTAIDIYGRGVNSNQVEILISEENSRLVDVYDIPGPFTWTKHASATTIDVIVIGGGGGGGGGDGAAGPSDVRGSGGGAGGGLSVQTFDAPDLSSTVSVTVGAGGVGGSGGFNAADNTTQGGEGQNGGNSSFGMYLQANGGGGGHSIFPALFNPAVGGSGTTANGSDGGLFSGNPGQNSPLGPSGGGGGADTDELDGSFSGGVGGNANTSGIVIQGGIAGLAGGSGAGGDGGNGSSGSQNQNYVGSGAGGGGSGGVAFAGQDARGGNGGTGGNYGGGGGGGGAAVKNGSAGTATGGNGGNGAGGVVIVITNFL